MSIELNTDKFQVKPMGKTWQDIAWHGMASAWCGVECGLSPTDKGFATTWMWMGGAPRPSLEKIEAIPSTVGH